MQPNRPFRTMLALGVALALPAAAGASPLDAEWLIRVGAFSPTYDTLARADARDGTVGTSVRFEEALGLRERSTLPILDVAWRIGRPHRIEASYVDLQRDATQTLTGTIQWDGQVFSASARVKSQFDSRILAVSYLYSPYRSENTELAGGVGLHTARLSAGVQLDGLGASTSGTVSSSAPLPVVALRATHRAAPNVYGEVRYQWFGLHYGDYKGRLNVLNAALTWQAWRRAGVELGYNLSDYDLKVSKDDWKGEARYRFQGPTLSLVASF